MNICSKPRIVFSLTTLPSRINSLLPTLISLSQQTIRADKIYLTIPEICKRLNQPYPKLPYEIYDYCEIIRVKNDYGPLTKLLGALINENNPDTIIITVDDDIIYPDTLIEQFLYFQGIYPDSALGSSGLSIGSYPFKYSIKFNQKKNDYWFTMKSTRGTLTDIIYGYAGALYLRKFFPDIPDLYDEFLKYSLSNEDLFKNDDVFISFYLNKENIQRRLVEISDVINKSGADALSSNVFKFFRSLERAVEECEKMGWFKTRASVNTTETFGALIILIIILLIMIILGIYLYFK